MSNNNYKKLTILFVALDSYGHLNSCIGVAEKLVQRGHRAVFALEQAWSGKIKCYPGLEEITFVDPNRDPNLDANEYWIQYMDKFKVSFSLSPMEKIETLDQQLLEDFYNVLLNVDGEIKKIIDDLKPNIIVVDSYTTVPAVYKSGIPWIWLTSAHPLSCLPSDNLPPIETDYPTNGDRKQWEEYKKKKFETFGEVMMRYNKRLVEEFDIEPLLTGRLCHPSPYLNIYAYPKELDYLDIRPLPEKWQNFDHFIRFSKQDDSFKIPDEFIKKPLGKLVYVSMGSMGSADFDLMNRLIKILSKSPNRFVFSLGARAEKLIHLPENIWGEKFIPQIQVLPMVDLVITHGGNNTVLESLHYGKPMIVTPLFDDQYNNAQRLTELGLGVKMNPYRCEPEELLKKVEELLNDDTIKERLEKISKRMQSSDSTKQVAITIEQFAAKWNIE